MGILTYKNLNQFFIECLEKYSQSLSKEAIFYLSEVLSSVILPDSPLSQFMEEYIEKPLGSMLNEAVGMEDDFSRFRLYKNLGDFCTILGGLYETERIDDRIIVCFGQNGYMGASRYYPWKGCMSVYPELSYKFPEVIGSLKRIRHDNNNRSMFDILEEYKRTKDIHVLEILPESGIIPSNKNC